MIVLSHPRSGSEWLCTGFAGYSYGWEILGWHSFRVPNPYFGLDLNARIDLIRRAETERRIHKIHGHQIREFSHEPGFRDLLLAIRNHDGPIYLVRRTNLRAACRSFLIALVSDNWHGSDQPDRGRAATYEEVFDFLHWATSGVHWMKKLLRVDFEVTYEEMLSGIQPPGWEPSHSPLRKRGTGGYRRLVANADEVELWMDEMGIPQSGDEVL